MTTPSLLAATEFRPYTARELDTFEALLRGETNMGDFLAIPARDLGDMVEATFTADMLKIFHVGVMVKRLEAMTPDIRYSMHTLIYLAFASDRVGVAVMWSYTMFDFWRTNKKILTLARFRETFPDGMPTEDAMFRIWDGQKRTDGSMSDNKIDGREAWA